jgi:hypothetical protein
MEVFIKKGGRQLLRKFIENQVVIKTIEVIIFKIVFKMVF